MFSFLTKLYPLALPQQWKWFLGGCYSEMMASAREATGVILVVHGESLTYNPFQNGNLTWASMLGDSIFHH